MVFYSEGDFWIVKSQHLQIQGRFQATQWTKDNDHTDYSSMTAIVMSGHIIHGSKIEVHAEPGSIICDGKEILQGFGEAHCGGAKITFDDKGTLVDDAMSFMAHKVVHVVFPDHSSVQVNRWPNFMNAMITMHPAEEGQDGVCGNFNGDWKDDAGKELHRRFGMGVHHHEDLFADHLPLHVPEKKPSAKRCNAKEIDSAAHSCKQKAFDAVHWSFAECMGDKCDRTHGSWQADALRKAYHHNDE